MGCWGLNPHDFTDETFLPYNLAYMHDVPFPVTNSVNTVRCLSVVKFHQNQSF